MARKNFADKNSRSKADAKKKRFVEEYLIDLNATKAAERAGYSKKTAGQIGHELLKIPEIAEAINQAKAERSERTQITADWVLQELAKLYATSMSDFLVDPGVGHVPHFDLSKSTPEQLASIETLQIDTYMEGRGDTAEEVKRIKLSLPSKLRTLELIGDHVNVQAFRKQEHKTGEVTQTVVHTASKEVLAAVDNIVKKL